MAVSANQKYDCIELDSLGNYCRTWQIQPVKQDFLPDLTDAEQAELVSAILGIMVIVWLFKQLKRAI